MTTSLESEYERLRNERAAEDTANVTAPKTWSTTSPTDHALLVEELKNRGIPAAVAGDLANDLAAQYLAQKGTLPSVFDLLADPTAINRTAYTQSGLYALPPAFGVRQPDGTVRFYKNSPLQGLQLVTASSDDFGFGLKEAASSRTPIFGADEVAAILASAGFGPDSPPGGGGAGSAAPVFDRDQLRESAATLWRGMLLTEPEDTDRHVDEYVTRATQFLVGEGGRLDFETFMLGRIRETPRYKMLYQNKAPGVTEQAHLAQYVNMVRDLGFADRRLGQLVEQGASSGVAPQGMADRLSKTGEVAAANPGRFSHQFANQISQLGIRGT